MRNTLSKEAEQKAIEAVKRAVHYVDDDKLTPDAAFTKVAREEKWAAEMIRFAARAYNTGRQTAQREHAKSAADKFADFALCDPEAVVRSVFPETVKTAADIHREAVSTEYTSAPAWPRLQQAAVDASRLRGLREKAAAECCPICKACPCVCGKKASVSLNPAADVFHEHKRLKTAAEEARYQAGSAYDQLVSAMGRLGDYFQKSAHDRLPFTTVAYYCGVKHGAAAEKLFGWVADRNKQWKIEPTELNPSIMSKMASAVVPYHPYVEPWKLVETCLRLGTEVAEKRAAHEQATAAMEAHALKDLAPYVTAPRVKVAAANSIMGKAPEISYHPDDVRAFTGRPLPKAAAAPPPRPAKNIMRPFDKTAGNATNWATGTAVGMGTKGLLDKAFGGQDPNDRVNDAWLDLEDPTHDAQLRNIRQTALLSDLMNDDVIGGHEPDQVAKAYNEISQMAPRAAGQPLAIRTLLRRHLSGNMEPHEVASVGDLEKKVMDTQTPTTPALDPYAQKAMKPQQKQGAVSRRIFDHAPVRSSILGC